MSKVIPTDILTKKVCVFYRRFQGSVVSELHVEKGTFDAEHVLELIGVLAEATLSQDNDRMESTIMLRGQYGVLEGPLNAFTPYILASLNISQPF